MGNNGVCCCFSLLLFLGSLYSDQSNRSKLSVLWAIVGPVDSREPVYVDVKLTVSLLTFDVLVSCNKETELPAHGSL